MASGQRRTLKARSERGLVQGKASRLTNISRLSEQKVSILLTRDDGSICLDNSPGALADIDPSRVWT